MLASWWAAGWCASRRTEFASGRIVETEGYTQDDPAFHGWNAIDHATGLLKPTGRGRDLFVAPGKAYVYKIYGAYWLLNVVTEPLGIGGGVLIRAVEPIDGMDLMYRDRPNAKREKDLGSGPGKLTQALDIGPEFHGTDLTRPPLYFLPPNQPVGDIAGHDAHRPDARHRAGLPLLRGGQPARLARRPVRHRRRP